MLENNFYESRPIVFMNQGPILDVISEGVRFDRISVHTLRIRTDRPDETV